MSKIWKVLGLFLICAALSYGATDATLTGVIKDPSGAPYRGAFVRAQNLQSKITVNVMSDGQGSYRIANLPPGDYVVRVTAVGYRSEPRHDVRLAAGDSSSLDFALQQGMVRWSDLSLYQAKMLLPPGKGKSILFGNCFACHGFQTRMAAVKRDLDGWKQAVNFMLETRHARLGNHINDEDAAILTNYLNDAFGADAKLAKSPAELPEYEATVRPLSDEALKITYVEYDMPGPNRMPFSAAPDKNGNLWIPDMGSVNTIGRLADRRDPGIYRS
jgi:mono/diheme cytochrome c family protein